MPIPVRSPLSILSSSAAAVLVGALVSALLAGCSQTPRGGETTDTANRSETAMADSDPEPTASRPDAATETATFGAGCFWCVEAVLEQIRGVEDVTSGYMGGETENPTYEQVCTGNTGHAEVVQVRFDPDVVRFADLVDLFWDLHDPTQLDRQGADVGTQYRSAIFYHSEQQREVAEASKQEAQKRFDDAVVTEITPASTFYAAEGYHQDYYFANKNAPYCRAVITPKLKKLGLEH